VSKPNKRPSYRVQVTGKLENALSKEDALPWEAHATAVPGQPINAKTGRRYTGGNRINLWLEQMDRASDDPRWMTFDQVKASGLSVRKGAKATYIEVWKWPAPIEMTEAIESAAAKEEDITLDASAIGVGESVSIPPAEPEEKSERPRRPTVRYYAVFNGQDVVGLAPYEKPEPNEPAIFSLTQLAERAGFKVNVVVTPGSVGGVDREQGVIRIPGSVRPQEEPRTEALNATREATLLYQLARAIGETDKHAKVNGESQVWAVMEEHLRLSIATQVLKDAFGVTGNPFPESWVDERGEVVQTVEYLSQVLTDNPNALFVAARDADAIANKVLALMPELASKMTADLDGLRVPDGERAPPKLGTGMRFGLPSFEQAAGRADRPAPQDEPVREKAAGKAPAAPLSDDPRWEAFVAAVRTGAKKQGAGARVDGMLETVAPTFSAWCKSLERAHKDDVVARVTDIVLHSMAADQKFEDEFGAGEPDEDGAMLEPLDSAFVVEDDFGFEDSSMSEEDALEICGP